MSSQYLLEETHSDKHKASTIPVAVVYPASTYSRTVPSIFLAVLPGWSHLWYRISVNEMKMKHPTLPPKCFQAVLFLPCFPLFFSFSFFLSYSYGQILIPTINRLTGKPLGIVQWFHAFKILLCAKVTKTSKKLQRWEMNTKLNLIKPSAS